MDEKIMPDIHNFHLDKTVNLSHILTTITILFAALLAFFSMSERLAILESQFEEMNGRVIQILEAQHKVDLTQDSSLIMFRTEMREDSREIQAKLDRLIETLIR